MKLYFNGCSHTYGDDLTDFNKAWPGLIAKQIGCNFVNDAVSGGTNDRIVYRTIKNAQNFDKVLLVDNGGKISLGAPAINGAKVTATVNEHVKGDKVIVFRKKRRKGYRKKNGHRQSFTSITISDIKA